MAFFSRFWLKIVIINKSTYSFSTKMINYEIGFMLGAVSLYKSGPLITHSKLNLNETWCQRRIAAKIVTITLSLRIRYKFNIFQTVKYMPIISVQQKLYPIHQTSTLKNINCKYTIGKCALNVMLNCNSYGSEIWSYDQCTYSVRLGIDYISW